MDTGKYFPLMIKKGYLKYLRIILFPFPVTNVFPGNFKYKLCLINPREAGNLTTVDAVLEPGAHPLSRGLRLALVRHHRVEGITERTWACIFSS